MEKPQFTLDLESLGAAWDYLIGQLLFISAVACSRKCELPSKQRPCRSPPRLKSGSPISVPSMSAKSCASIRATIFGNGTNRINLATKSSRGWLSGCRP